MADASALKCTVTDKPLIDAWHEWLSSARSITYRDQEVIYGQQTVGTHVYLVAQGYVKLSRCTASGDVFTIALLGPGNLFGRVAATGTSDQGEVACASGTTVVLRCTCRQFEKGLEAGTGLAQLTTANLAARLYELGRRLEYTLYRELRGRVAAVLRDLVGLHGGICRHGHMLDVRLTQQELAELIGASRPAVSAELNELRRAGLIDYTRAFICVINIDALERLAE